MRITGLATGLDVDSIVEQTMSAYRTKIDQQAQKKDISEIKQKLYTDIMKESKDFYNKHFDILKSDSLFSSSNWQNVKFTSSSTSVKVSGNSEAKAENYKISGNTATSASVTITEGITAGSKILVNGKEFTLGGTTSKDISAFNEELKATGINVSARYTAFTGAVGDTNTNNKPGLIFESTKLGSGNTFTVGGSSSNLVTEGNTTKGIDATFTTVDLGNSLSGTISINGTYIDLDVLTDEVTTEELVKYRADNKISEDISDDEIKIDINKKNINSELIENGVKAELIKDGDNYKVVSTVAGSGGEVNINSLSLVDGEDKPIGKSTKGIDATFTTVDLGNSLSGKISINGTYIDLGITTEELVKYRADNKISEDIMSDDEIKIDLINSKLDKNGAKAELIIDGNDYKVVSTIVGSKGTSDIRSITIEDDKLATDGEDANIIIEDSKGGVYTHKESSNTFTVDGVTFDFKGKIEAGDKAINISGETNTDAIKEKIINLFNDYNTLMEKLNTLTTEKKNKGYDPLTKEQRSELSEEEVKLWDAKVQQGQLYKDSDLTRITNSLKSAMRTMVSGTGLNLEQIGIIPVADYGGVKNGTFIIDETKLSKGLETNLDDIKNMFVSAKPSEGTDSEKYSKTGIMYRMKDIIYSETMISTSALSKKAGLLGTATATDNTLSKAIKAYERKMEDMEVIFSRKEQLLYSQYAKLETAMNNYNAQQSSLSQAFGATS